MFSSFLWDANIECQYRSELRTALFVHDGDFCNVAFVDGADANGANWDGRLCFLPQELKQRFQRPKRRSLDHDTLLIGTEFFLQTGQVRHDLSLDVLHLVVGTDNQDRGAGHDLLQSVTNHLDTQRALKFLVVYVLGFDSHLSTWGWCEQTTYLRDNGTVQCAKDSFIAFSQISIDHKNIHSHPQPINCLYFQNGTLQIGTPHQLLPQLPLGNLT
mmetsp:Transcript_24604/g.59317  ORF Transcript_24604/g.59317 Transcript_24604/m.59317 type:complete len:215 (+) Transcript_24604:634-1278(+)